jgi:NADPH2 dehydrogenase
VGLITEPAQAQEIIASGKADLVALARGMLFNPRWGWHAAAKLGATVDAPQPYWRAPPHGHTDLFNNTSYGAR